VLKWIKADDLRLTIFIGLRKGLSLIRGTRRSLTEDDQHRIANAIAEQLRRSNWKIEQAGPLEGHGHHLTPKK
jgi:hypothetical protein